MYISECGASRLAGASAPKDPCLLSCEFTLGSLGRPRLPQQTFHHLVYGWSTARGGWTPVQVTVLRVASSSSAQAGYLQCECTYSSDSAVFSSLVELLIRT